MQVTLLPSKKIDKQKWDDCIKSSSNNLIYATSVYLDCMADNWDGFIADDYNIVMPVPWRKKYGIKYCYNVAFVQQLGVFGKNLEQKDIDVFIEHFQKNYKYGDYAFNYLNQAKNAQQRNNYILILSSKYEILKQFYLSHLEKNLHKAKNFLLKYESGDIDTSIEMFRKLYAHRFKNVTLNDYKNFTALCKLKEKENNIIVRKVCNDTEILAAVLIMKDERRLYNLMVSVTQTGRQQSAGPFLYNELIKEFSHTGMLLDFEGSDITGIEFFYKGFGAVNQPYCAMHINNLFFPLRFFKR